MQQAQEENDDTNNEEAAAVDGYDGRPPRRYLPDDPHTRDALLVEYCSLSYSQARKVAAHMFRATVLVSAFSFAMHLMHWGRSSVAVAIS